MRNAVMGPWSVSTPPRGYRCGEEIARALETASLDQAEQLAASLRAGDTSPADVVSYVEDMLGIAYQSYDEDAVAAAGNESLCELYESEIEALATLLEVVGFHDGPCDCDEEADLEFAERIEASLDLLPARAWHLAPSAPDQPGLVLGPYIAPLDIFVSLAPGSEFDGRRSLAWTGAHLEVSIGSRLWVLKPLSEGHTSLILALAERLTPLEGVFDAAGGLALAQREEFSLLLARLLSEDDTLLDRGAAEQLLDSAAAQLAALSPEELAAAGVLEISFSQTFAQLLAVSRAALAHGASRRLRSASTPARSG